ncbi:MULTISPECIES: hypothetical protein [Streptacidiphilus]|uniref:Uncharacterized protein n=1 Tax=Streptacidiphilus cavernicola TaxID=3342716 RepID=A0ABV6UVY6_9ACTN|nr:hypothetical protein [Streptacidiphilus jeojiense]
MLAEWDQYVGDLRPSRFTSGVAAELLLPLRTELLHQTRQGARVTYPGQGPAGEFANRSVEVLVGPVVVEQFGEPVGVRGGRRAQYRQNVRGPQPDRAVRTVQQAAGQRQQGSLRRTPLGQQPPSEIQCRLAQLDVPQPAPRLQQPDSEGQFSVGIVSEQSGGAPDQVLAGPGTLDGRGVPDLFEARSQRAIGEHLDQPVQLTDRQIPVDGRGGVHARDPPHRIVPAQHLCQRRPRLVDGDAATPFRPAKGKQQRETDRRVGLHPPPLQQPDDPGAQR